MAKQIFSIGYSIPTFDECSVSFYDERSLMDADILLICPDALYPSGDWVKFTSSDDGCYNVSASKTFKEKIFRMRKEITDHLKAGKNVFVFLTKDDDYHLANSVSSDKKGRQYSTEMFGKYNFLPINVGSITSASGQHVEFAGNPIFRD